MLLRPPRGDKLGHSILITTPASLESDGLSYALEILAVALQHACESTLCILLHVLLKSDKLRNRHIHAHDMLNISHVEIASQNHHFSAISAACNRQDAKIFHPTCEKDALQKMCTRHSFEQDRWPNLTCAIGTPLTLIWKPATNPMPQPWNSLNPSRSLSSSLGSILA